MYRMGGKHLADHRAIYRQLGICHLFSFDKDASVVARQDFNKPIGQAMCREMLSGALTSQIDTIMQNFSKAENLIVWLDYTDPHARRAQLQEFIELLKRLQPSDVLRITLNASLGTLGESPESWRKEGYDHPSDFRLERLKAELGDLVPTDLGPIGDSDFAFALAKCVELAVSHAESEVNDISLDPLLVTSYKDGQRMLTVTVRASSVEDRTPGERRLKSWPFKTASWTKIEFIEAPDLSSKERQKIDNYLHMPPSHILRRLRFEPESSREKSLRVISSYKRFHRYYPDFRNIEF